jgi:hypothetical protein
MRVEAGNIEVSPSGKSRRKLGFWKDVSLNKFSKSEVLAFLLMVVTFVVYTLTTGDLITGNLLVIALIGLILVVGVIAYPKFGIITLLVAGYLLGIPGKMSIDFPLGTLLDSFLFLLIIGFFFKQKGDRDYSMFRGPLSTMLLIWIFYNVVEVFNPMVVSREAWLYTIRSTAVIILTYYIFIYHIRDVNFIKLLFKIWIGLALLGAINGFTQEVFGFLPYEKKWLYSDPLRVELYFQGGHMRKFSIFSDPVAFGYNMASAATLCVAWLFAPIKLYKKFILAGLAGFFLLTMVFSGTRGAFPLLPAALGLMVVLKLNKRVLMFALVMGGLFVGLIFVPTSNQNIMRFQTAFRPKNDASFNARKINQARIRPYIQSHPMGGGLGTTGYWGQRFSPNTYLANFPPDSGYVRVAVELGPIGIIIICLLIFVALRTGINNYYLIKDPELKTICMGMVMVVFMYNVGNYPQEAVAQYPSNVLFFLCMALMQVTKRLDDQKNKLAQLTPMPADE